MLRLYLLGVCLGGLFLTADGRYNPSDVGLRGEDEIAVGLRISCDDIEECKEDSRFICGSNGITYESTCKFTKEICKERNFNFDHFGACTASEKCRGHRLTSLAARNDSGVFVPVCKHDGTYAAIQCHKGTGYCWCSYPDGSLLHGTALLSEKPNCAMVSEFPHQEIDMDKRPPSERPKGGCAGSKRRLFNSNLIKHLIQEFKRDRGALTVTNIETSALRWKFNELDVKNDNKLRRRETKDLQRLIRRYVKPRKCAKKFPMFCDENKDKKISLLEWIRCFSTEQKHSNKKKKNRSRNRQATKVIQIGVGPVTRPVPCEREMKQAEEASSLGQNEFYIPKCDNNGYYKPVQCYGSADRKLWYCFCVDAQTGNMIENTSVQHGSPECPLASFRKPWPGCPAPDLEATFLESLMAYFVKFSETLRRPIKFKYGSTNEERSLQKIFVHIDKNRNGQIDKKEKRKLKKLIKKQAPLWKCGRKIHLVCDINDDKRISLPELKACIIAPRIDNSIKSISKTNGNGRRKSGKNPFIEVIKSV